jgi:acetyl esterase
VELHPQVERLLATYREAGLPRLAECTVDDARQRPAAIRALLGDGPEIACVEDIELAGVPARRYLPEEPVPGTLVWFHGGGFVVGGGVALHDPICKTLAKVTSLEVVSVDYRLAPEHPFPAGLDDAYAAFEAVADDRPDAPIVVGGDSSGGNFAAVVCQLARDRGRTEIALQVLVVPVTDCGLDTGSYRAFGDVGLPLGRADMAWFWDHYIADPAARSDPRASPLRAGDLGGLPPAFIVLAGADVLHDEGLAYAERLTAAGVEVEVLRFEDMHHGFFVMTGILDRADEAIAKVAAAVTRRVSGTVRS